MTQRYKSLITDHVVKVSCDDKHGTAFFITPNHLLTAYHVVVAAVNDPNIYARVYYKGTEYHCTAKRLKAKKDVAILTIYNISASEPLKVLQCEYSDDTRFSVVGYPHAISGGKQQICYKLKYEMKVNENQWNHQAFIDDDTNLTHYQGFSGGPILNSYGSVIGIAVKQINSGLGFLSIDEIADSLPEDCELCTDWQKEDDGLYGLARSLEFSMSRVEDAHGRYDSYIDVPNTHTEITLTNFCNRRYYDFLNEQLKNSVKRIKNATKLAGNYRSDTFAHFVEDYEADRDQTKEGNHASEYMAMDNPALEGVERCIRTIKGDLDYLTSIYKQFMLVYGEAGTGKTHSICHFIEKGKHHVNLYLLYGSSFRSDIDIRKQICEQIGISVKDGFVELNQKMVERSSFAVIIIDALNEGASDSFWQSGLTTLTKTLEKHENIRLIVTVREPFDKVIDQCIDERFWYKHKVEGFSHLKNAVQMFFNKYLIPLEYADTYKEELKNPLFMKIFCQAFYRLKEDERASADRMKLYHHFLTIRNERVCEMVDEDKHRNVTEDYIRKLCAYSIFYKCGSLISRKKARQYADQICRGRFWSKSLLNAMIKESLLLETKSLDLTEDELMLEYDNMADFYKADALLKSRMDGKAIVQFLLDCKRRLLNDDSLNRQKFVNCIGALISIWNRDDVNLLEYKPFIDNFNESFDRAKRYGGVYHDDIVKYLRINQRYTDPMDVIGRFNNGQTDGVLDWHRTKMLPLDQHTLDCIWTSQVDMVFEWFRYSYSTTELATEDVEQKKALILVHGWLLASSHPVARAMVKRRLYRLVRDNEALVYFMLEEFNSCCDAYVLEGIYNIAYGAVLVSSNVEFCNKVADLVFAYNYAAQGSAPDNVLIRQWTLKILERAKYLNPASPYWDTIQLPFTNTRNPLNWLADTEIEEGYFGESRGSGSLYYSMTNLMSDFTRYIFGTNSRAESTTHVKVVGNECKGIEIDHIINMTCREIMNLGWSDELGKFDNSRSSSGRFNNELERLGKKYQWMALYNIEGLLMDHLDFISADHYVYKPTPEDLSTPYPWHSRHRSHFDVTLTTVDEQKLVIEKLFDDVKVEELDDRRCEDWIMDGDIIPSINPVFTDKNGDKWVTLYRYHNVEKEIPDGKKSLCLIYTPVLIKNEDEVKFEAWAADQNFYGRWMPEHMNGDTDTLWNEYPWAESFTGREDDEKDDRGHGCPCELRLPYESFLQEDCMGIDEETHPIVSNLDAPSADIMNFLELCTAERGVIRKKSADGKGRIVAINLDPYTNMGMGVIIRQDEIDNYLKAHGYTLYYSHVGEKTYGRGEFSRIFDIRRYTGASKYKLEGNFEVIQPITDEKDYVTLHPEPARKTQNDESDFDWLEQFGVTEAELDEPLSKEDCEELLKALNIEHTCEQLTYRDLLLQRLRDGVMKKFKDNSNEESE